MNGALDRLRELKRWLRPYLHICHLHRPIDLLLLLLPALWTVSLATEPYHSGEVAALLLAAALVRSAAWVYNDLLDARMLAEAPESFTARGLVPARDGWRLFAGLLSLAALLLLALDATALLWSAPALLLLLGYPHLKQRTLLTQPYLGLCFAWMVALAQVVSPGIGPKTLWLLFTATLLWSTSFTLLYAMPRRAADERAGIGSMLYLLGERGGMVVLFLQLLTVVALWFAGRQLHLGDNFGLGLLGALALSAYQQWQLASHPASGATRAYRSNLLFGLAVLAGLLGGQP